MERKYFQNCKITDINVDEKTMTVIASTEDVDRYKDIMKIAGCKYKLPMPFLWAHNRKDDLPPIGRIMSVRRRKGPHELVARLEFAPTEFAQSIYELYKGEFLNGISIGFIPIKEREPTKEEEKKGAKRIIEDWELLEISAVPVPANPNAMAESVKSGELQLPEMVYKDFGFEETKEIPDEDDEPIETEEEAKEDIPELEEKPLENFHSCDINSKKYPKYRIEKCAQKHDGKCIDVNWGILGPNKSEISSLRYDIKIWTKSSARSHCELRKGKFIPATKDIKAKTFNCECIKCGHKLKSEKHCNELKCPKCGGEMRRVERPGPGKDIEITTLTNEQIKQVQSIFDNMLKKIRGKESEKDYINIIEPIITFKDSPQETTEPEKSEESEDVKELAKELAKDFVDSFLGDFRRDVLGIVDDK